jgi:hypothetical protein
LTWLILTIIERHATLSAVEAVPTSSASAVAAGAPVYTTL